MSALNITNTQYQYPRYLRSDHVDNYTNLTRDSLSIFGDPFLNIPDPDIKQYYCYAIFTKEQPASAAAQIRSRCWLHHITAAAAAAAAGRLLVLTDGRQLA